MILNLFQSRFKQYVKNAGIYFFTSIFVAIVGIVLNPLMAKNLDPLDYAIVGYFTSYNLLLQPLLHLCIITFFARQYYFTPEEKRTDLEHTIAVTIVIMGFFVLVVFLAGFYLYYSNTEHTLPFWPYALLAFMQVYVGNITTLYLTKLRITRQANKYAIVSISQCLITQSGMILLVVLLHKGAYGKLSAALIASVIFAIYSCTKLFHKNHFDKQILKSALKFGYPLAIAALFWYFLTGVDKFFLEKLNDPDTFGLYNVGVSIAGYMTICYSSISSTFEPDIYKSIAEKNNKKLLAILGIIIAVTIVANLLFALFAPQIIGLLTAGRYVDSCPYARIISLHNITMALYTMTVSVIVGYGYVKQQLALRISGAVASIFIYKYLIESFGFIGAAWGQVLSFLFLFVISITFLLIKVKKDSSRLSND